MADRPQPTMHQWDYPDAQGRRCVRCMKTDAEIGGPQDAPCRGIDRGHRPKTLISHDEISSFGSQVTTVTDDELRQAVGAAVSRRNIAEQRLFDANKESDALHSEMTRRGLAGHTHETEAEAACCIEKRIALAAALANERRKGRNAKF